MTCSGGVAVVDMMLHLIAAQNGTALADAVADLMIHASVRTSVARQRPRERADSPGSGIVRRAVALMEDHVEPVLAVEAIAARLGQSPRQLERLFGHAFGVPPKRYYDLIRLRRARKLITETDTRRDRDRHPLRLSLGDAVFRCVQARLRDARRVSLRNHKR